MKRLLCAAILCLTTDASAITNNPVDPITLHIFNRSSEQEQMIYLAGCVGGAEIFFDEIAATRQFRPEAASLFRFSDKELLIFLYELERQNPNLGAMPTCFALINSLIEPLPTLNRH